MPSLSEELANFVHDFVLPDRPDPFKKAREVVSFRPDDPERETAGTLFIIAGDYIYSPNCKDYPSVPAPIDENATLWIEPGLSWPSQLRRPRWWSEDTAYLAFFALNPRFEVKPFNKLFELDAYLVQRVRGRGYTMTSARKLAWYTMERRLNLVVRALSFRYQVPPMRQIIKTARLCTGYFPTKPAYCHAFLRSKAWFGVVMAQISYLIAVAHSIDGEPLDLPYQPTWFNFLLDIWPGRYWDIEFLDRIRAVMGKFGPETPRAGVFINILDPPPHQFSSNWLKSVGIPVYYPFANRDAPETPYPYEITCMYPPLPLLSEIQVHIKKAAATHKILPPDFSITHNPFTEPPLVNDTSSSHFESLAPRTTATPTDIAPSNAALALSQPWVPFLEERRRKLQQRINNETPQEKQRRLQRESCPPDVNTVVFVWEENDHGSYDRVRVGKKLNRDTLSDFKASQKVYNPIFNEWDCWYDFSEEPDDEDDDEDEDDVYNRDGRSIPSHPLPSDEDFDYGPFNLDNDHEPALMQPHEEPPPNFAEETETLNLDHQTNDMASFFTDYYGYQLPLQVPPIHLPPLTPSQITRLRTYVGKTRDSCTDGLDDAILLDLYSFMSSVLRYKSRLDEAPTQSMYSWDLVFGNPNYIGMRWRTPTIRPLINGDMTLYLFDFKDRGTEPWFIAVTSITLAFCICRMPPNIDEYDICHRLMTMGSRFLTLTRVPKYMEPVLPWRIPRRSRPANYRFTIRDYEIYVSHRRDILSNSRVARAALMRGGIFWRICDLASTRPLVCDGPTKYVTEFGMSASFDNGSLHDDYVSAEELDAISGTYILPTGMGEQDVTVSWWPPESIWNQYYDFDYWTDVMELKFLQRLKELDQGEAQPLPKQKWKSWIRGGSSSREGSASIANASLACFNKVVADLNSI